MHPLLTLATIYLLISSCMFLVISQGHERGTKKQIIDVNLATLAGMIVQALLVEPITDLGLRWFQEYDGCMGIKYDFPPSHVALVLIGVIIQFLTLIIRKQEISKIRLFLFILLINVVLFGLLTLYSSEF